MFDMFFFCIKIACDFEMFEMFESVFQCFFPFKFSQFANGAGASGAAPLSGTGLIRAASTLVRCHVRS